MSRNHFTRSTLSCCKPIKYIVHSMNQIVESNTKSAYSFSSFFPRFHKMIKCNMIKCSKSIWSYFSIWFWGSTVNYVIYSLLHSLPYLLSNYLLKLITHSNWNVVVLANSEVPVQLVSLLYLKKFIYLISLILDLHLLPRA